MIKIMDAEAITRNTYNRIARAYSFETSDSRVRLGIAPSLLKFSWLIPQKGRVLVAGAGDGRDALQLKKRGITPVCLDYAHSMNVIARRRDRAELIVTADVRALPFGSEAFDGVWASMCLYHLRINSMKVCLREIRRVLRPGGLFYFNLRPGNGQRMIPYPWSFPHGGPRYYARYLQSQVRYFANEFSLIRVQGYDRRLGPHLIQVWLRRPAAR